MDPWNDQLQILKSKPAGPMAEDEKKPFQITPFVFYLTRRGENPPPEAPSQAATAATKLDTDSKP